MHDVLVLADPTTAGAFLLTDLSVRSVREDEPVAQILEEVLAKDYAVVLVAEPLARSVVAQIRERQARAGPILVVIPGTGPGRRIAEELLAGLTRSIVGT